MVVCVANAAAVAEAGALAELYCKIQKDPIAVVVAAQVELKIAVKHHWVCAEEILLPAVHHHCHQGFQTSLRLPTANHHRTCPS